MVKVVFDYEFFDNSDDFIRFCNMRGQEYFYEQMGFLDLAEKLLLTHPRIGGIPHEHKKAGFVNPNRLEFPFADEACDMRLFYMIEVKDDDTYVILVQMQHKRSPIKV